MRRPGQHGRRLVGVSGDLCPGGKLQRMCDGLCCRMNFLIRNSYIQECIRIGFGRHFTLRNRITHNRIGKTVQSADGRGPPDRVRMGGGRRAVWIGRNPPGIPRTRQPAGIHGPNYENRFPCWSTYITKKFPSLKTNDS